VPSLAGLVGSVVLPVLGAVPDGAIMLFSGLGADAQNQLSVGVGALAGSTIMLLTVPWGAAIIAGRVGIGKDGLAKYKVTKKKGSSGKTARQSVHNAKMQGEQKNPSFLTATGVSPLSSIKDNAYVMVGTSLVYLLIQGPAFAFGMETPATDAVNAEVSLAEQWWSLGGLIVAILAFIGYLLLMIQQAGGADHADKVDGAIIKMLHSNSPVTLSGVLYPMIADGQQKINSVRKSKGLMRSYTVSLLDKDKRRLGKVLQPFFDKYDTDGDGKIDVSEMHALLADVNEQVSTEKVKGWMAKMDPSNSGSIDTSEFVDAMLLYITAKAHEQSEEADERKKSAILKGDVAPDEEEKSSSEDEQEEEDVEMPEDLQQMGWKEQQAHIMKRSAKMMGVGTLIILVFSDPMVDVMSNVGARLSIPPFYVAFVLAPLASNASEFIASYNYAGKKTQKTITVSLAALEGAACMNNTFCLAIFMGLVFFKQLAWKFSAETIAVLLIELIVGLIALRPTMPMWVAIFLLSLFPASIVFIAALEAIGLD